MVGLGECSIISALLGVSPSMLRMLPVYDISMIDQRIGIFQKSDGEVY